MFKFHTNDYTKDFSEIDVENSKWECICACTGLLFFVPLVSIPESKYGRYYANQGLLILILEIICGLIGFIFGKIFWLLSLIPLFGIVFNLINIIVGIILAGICIYFIAYAISKVAHKQAKDLPIFGQIRIIK